VQGSERFFSRPMGQTVESWGTPSWQGMERDRCRVARAMVPAPQTQTTPGERQGPDSGLR
jgi:hypothetical protein